MDLSIPHSEQGGGGCNKLKVGSLVGPARNVLNKSLKLNYMCMKLPGGQLQYN